MTNLTFEQFKELTQQYNLIPIYDTLPADLDTPVSAFLKLKTDRYDFLFESVLGGEKWARYSFLGTTPLKVYQYLEGNLEILTPDGKKQVIQCAGQSFSILRKEFEHFQTYEDSNLPRFFGGAVGYIGYDMVKEFEGIHLQNSKNKDLADMCLILTDTVVIFDNLYQSMFIVNSVHVEDADKKDTERLKDLYDQAITKIKFVQDKLKSDHRASYEPTMVSALKENQNTTEKMFCEKVVRAKEYIAAGDIFQVVLSQSFELAGDNLDPMQVYRSIRRINPSPYMYYLRFKDLAVVGASPEVMVRLEDKKVEVRPIAGTRKRGLTEEEDVLLEKELQEDPKERAEHIMLVDLGRNDIGRVAKTGTVQVDEKEIIERYSHVMHLVSHVSGELHKDKDVFDVISATFPAGTLSGAPKVRAMEIIEELEEQARGIYGGAIGYISFTKNADLAIAIRTAVIQKDKITVQAGAGIVYDSEPHLEHKECCNKAKAMIEAIKK